MSESVQEIKVKITADSRGVFKAFDEMVKAGVKGSSEVKSAWDRAMRMDKRKADTWIKGINPVYERMAKFTAEWRNEASKFDSYVRNRNEKNPFAMVDQYLGEANGAFVPQQVSEVLPEKSVYNLNTMFEKMKINLDKIKGTDTFKKMAKDLKDSSKSASTLGKFFNRIGSYSLYRVVRAVVTSIAKGFSEGVQNLYQFSKLTQDGGFSKSMDQLATSVLQIKNAIAVSFAPFITGVFVPLVNKVSQLFVKLSDNISMFSAKLRGETRYLAVNTAYTKELAKAQRQLLGFDELNILNTGDDYSNMFKYMEMVGASNSLGLKFADFIASFDFDAAYAVSKLLVGFVGLFEGASIGMSLGGVGGAVVGALIGASLTAGVVDVIFENMGANLDIATAFGDVLKKASPALVLAGGIVGGKVGFNFFPGIPGALIGFGIGAALTFWFLDIIMDATECKFDTNEKIKEIFNGLRNFVAVSGGLAGAIAGAKAGGMIGAFIGGAVPGALIGLVIGASLTISIFDVLFNWDSNETEFTKELNDTLAKNGITKVYDPETGGEVLMNSGTAALLDSLNNQKRNYRITTKANGGFVPQGDLFLANEAGPELVGTIGNRTAVTNQDQFIVAMEGANAMVVNAIYQAVNSINGAIANQPVPSIKIGDREIYRASQRGQRALGGNLVQGV